jgi:hypothetical protein
LAIPGGAFLFLLLVFLLFRGQLALLWAFEFSRGIFIFSAGIFSILWEVSFYVGIEFSMAVSKLLSIV